MPQGIDAASAPSYNHLDRWMEAAAQIAIDNKRMEAAKAAAEAAARQKKLDALWQSKLPENLPEEPRSKRDCGPSLIVPEPPSRVCSPVEANQPEFRSVQTSFFRNVCRRLGFL